MKKLISLIFLILICLIPSVSHATAIYVAQVSAGGNTGADCADARAMSSLIAGDEVAGNVIHLCSAITSGFSILGSGAAGNVLSFVWESGARVSVAHGGIINIGAHNYLLFDGGIACGPKTACYATELANLTGYAAGQAGIIEATNNGSALANQDTNTQAFYGCNVCHDIEIKNLIIRNLYQHTLLTDSTGSADSGDFIWQCPGGGSGCGLGAVNIHDNAIHDTGNAISIQKNGSTVITVANNEMWRNNWAIENSGNGQRSLIVHDNHFHDAKNWDTNADTYHHNALHNYMNTASDSTLLKYYNNLSDGDWGSCCTTSTMIFVETIWPANFSIFNNVDLQSCNSNRAPAYWLTVGPVAQGPTMVNNTTEGCATTSSNTESTQFQGGTNVNFQNNAIEGYGQYILTSISGSSTTFSPLDYNTYGAIGLSGNSPWQCGVTGDNTFTAWKASCGGDSHGQKVASNNVSTITGAPNSGSPLIGAGVNLTASLCGTIPEICTDKNGVARPSGVTAWDVGAIQFSAGTPLVSLSPTFLVFGNVINATTSNPQTITLTNTGAASLVMTSVTLTGANPAQFTISANTCTGTIVSLGTCTTSVKFTPNAGGNTAFGANLTYTTNAASSPDNAALTGTGISAATGTTVAPPTNVSAIPH